MTDVPKLPIPKGTIPFPQQVAGHTYEKGKMGFLLGPDGKILKPFQAPPRGLREFNFYQEVYSEDGDEKLRMFMPPFHGTWKSPDVECSYLILDDLTASYKHPCIADLKIGLITYDSEATEEKIRMEKKKVAGLEKVGFQFQGMRIYDKDAGCTTLHTKQTLREKVHSSGTEYKGLSLMKQFFDPGQGVCIRSVKAAMNKLRQIEEWFENQRRYCFISSSILLIYEGDLENEETEAKVDVRMIDFAHVFHTSERDDNYLFGLKTLIKYLDIIVNSHSH